MKRKKLLTFLSLAGFIVIAASPLHNQGEVGSTGSPGESDCSGCHKGGVAGSVTISGIPDWKYKLDSTYHITVTVSQISATMFGLGVEALKKSDNTDAGLFTITDAGTQLLPGNGRQNVVHKTDGGKVTTSGSRAFTFDWKAPATDEGVVTFYVASIAGPADASMSTKTTYTKSQLVNSPTTTVGIEKLTSVSGFSIYPNPVKDVINISFINSVNGNVKATLHSINGQKVADLFNENMPKGAVEKHIAVSDKWVEGTYFMQMEQGGKSTVQKILIQ